jgi:uncharacterized protein (TIGR02217 family)
MAILNEVISTAVTRGSRGGPQFKRIKVYTEGGALKQRFLWSRQKIQFDLSYGIKTQQDFEEIRALFYVVFDGQLDGFLVRDWGDYRLDADTSSLTLISGTNWQINRRYNFRGHTVDRPITRPESGLLVYDAGGTLLGATVDDETGIAAVPAGTPAYCVGTFNVPATFVNDTLEDIELDGIEGNELQELPSIPLEEIREAEE